MGQNSVWYGTVYTPYGDIDVTDGLIYGQLLSGGSVDIHGGSPTKVGTLTGNTTVDFVLSDHIATYGSQCYTE